MARIRHIFVSPGHNYFGHFGGPAGEHAVAEVETAECVSGQGIRGDRFFGYKEDYKGQLTLFSWEVFTQLKSEMQAPEGIGPEALRRNIIVEGLDLGELIGREFELQGVRLQGVEECRPCVWMDQAVKPGTEQWMKGRGGLRCRILSDGIFRRDRPPQA